MCFVIVDYVDVGGGFDGFVVDVVGLVLFVDELGLGIVFFD